MKNIIYFQLNNWFAGKDYPDAEPFNSWMSNLNDTFLNVDWVKKNKLCVFVHNVDMSVSLCITAPKKLVSEQCPELLTMYKSFIVKKNSSNEIKDKFGYSFLDYNESNINFVWSNED